MPDRSSGYRPGNLVQATPWNISRAHPVWIGVENKGSIRVSSVNLRRSSSNTALVGGAARLPPEAVDVSIQGELAEVCPLNRSRHRHSYLKRSLIVLLFAIGTTAAGAWPPPVGGDGTVEDVKTINVIASQFKFEPASITVAQGDSVRLRLHSIDRTHGIAIKAFRVKALLPKTETVTVEFVADHPGTFDFTCSEYCGTGHAAMKGRLVVLAREK